jgi:hypothetical protein
VGIGTAGVSSYFYTGVSGGDVSLPIGLSVPYPSLDLNFQNMTTMDSRVTFTRASDATYFDSSGVLQTAGNNVPRFDVNPTTLDPLGLLIEEQRTNSIRNNTMQGAVAGTPGTAPTNWTMVSTLSGLTREIVSIGVENGINYIDVKWSGTTSVAVSSAILAQAESSAAVAASVGQSWSGSWYLRLVNGSFTGLSSLRIQITERNSAGAFVAASELSVLSSVNSNGLATQRYTISRTLTNATVAQLGCEVRLSIPTSTAVDFTLRIGLPQLELGAFATSVIPTVAATATRNADVAVMTGTNFSSWYRADEGTMYAEFAWYGPSNFDYVFSISDGTSSNLIASGITSAGASRFIIISAGVTEVGQSVGVMSANTVYRQIVAYATNNSAIYSSSGASGSDNTCSIPTGLDQASFNASSGTTNQLNGTIRKIAFYPTRLSNAQLQALTR